MKNLSSMSERLEPLKMHLISQHEDKDDDSLYMRYCELLQYTLNLEQDLDITKRVLGL